MFRLTKKAGYGLMALKYIATYAGDGALRAREIDEAYNIPPQRLAKAGIVRSQAGIKGGYSLPRPPQQISAFDIVRAIDGPLFLASYEKGCEIAERCTIKRPLAPVNDSILDLLRRISVAGLTGPEQKTET